MPVIYMAPVGNDARSWDWVDLAEGGVKHEFPGFGRPRAAAQPTPRVSVPQR